MIRPSSLYRSDSRRQPNLEANANNISEDSIDCGITALRCCNSPGCQKMANKRTFTIILIACGFIQGAIESYFKISAKQAALSHEYNPSIVDWLLVASGIFQVFAIFVGYWGNRIHRTGWFGALFMLQAFVCVLVVIPTLVHHSEENNTLDAIELSLLCIRHRSENLMSKQVYSTTTLVLLFNLQLFIGLSVSAFYTLGISYLDDNVIEHESPGLIAAALAARFWGTQLGSLISVIVGWSTFDWFFGWIILAPLLFFAGFLIVMFPRKLLSTVVRQAADNILETSTNNSHASLSNRKFIADVNFYPSLCRIFTNKIVLLNIFAAVFVQTGIVNFFRYEAEYLQSRFYLPANEIDGLTNEWTTFLISNLLKPPMLALAILVSGLIIAKANPAAKKIVSWNICACSLVVVFFLLSVFIDCEKSPIAGAYRGKIIKPMCASECLCADTAFMPVCPENSVKTFYSPCYAGCGAEITINEIRMFGNCSCGIDSEIPLEDSIATEGGCGMSNCRPYYIAFHGLVIMAAALIASTLVGKLIIGIRAVLPQDKALAIAAEVMFVGIFVFIPGKIGYAYLAERTCQYEAPDGFRCFLHESPLFGDWINVITAILIVIGIVFEVILMFCVNDLELYGEEESTDSQYRQIEMNTYSRNGDSYNPPEMVSQNPEPDHPPQTAALLQNYLQSIPPPAQRFSPAPDVTYAQIQRRLNESNEGLDFRLQTPQTDENSSIASDYRSVTSNGYLNFTPINRQPSNRPQSPETDF